MTQTLRERLNYHPDPRCPPASDRKVSARVELIQKKVDVTNKVVLDLGCSGGIFSFALARRAKRVIAIDGDAEIIERNRAIKNDLNLANVEFVHAAIDSGLIESIGRVDVTLFLSVYHHMLAVSEAYDWNAGCTHEAASQLIDTINNATNVLCFEVGYPNEGYEWCTRLPPYGDDWDKYVVDNIFKGAYRSIELLDPPTKVGWLNRHFVSRISEPYREDSALVQRVKGFFGYDPRDLRKLYIGRKRGCV